jgi:hypothetical protein
MIIIGALVKLSGSSVDLNNIEANITEEWDEDEDEKTEWRQGMAVTALRQGKYTEGSTYLIDKEECPISVSGDKLEETEYLTLAPEHMRLATEAEIRIYVERACHIGSLKEIKNKVCYDSHRRARREQG